MAAQVKSKLALLVISLIVAVISLPVTAAAISMPTWAKPIGVVAPELRAPIRVAVTADGGFYVSDPRNGGVLKYSPSGILLKKIKTTGVPQSVAILSNGNLVVTISAFGTSYASIIDSVSGLEVQRLKNGASDYHFGFADGVAVDDGVGNPGSVPYIYVIDVLSLTAKIFNSSNGAYVSQFSVRGAPEGVNALAGIPTSIPTFIVFEKKSGLLAVVDRTVIGDSANGRVIRFYDKAGAVVNKFGVNGPVTSSLTAPNLTFTSPQSITFEYNTDGTVKRMYVVDTFNSTIQVVTPSSGTISGATTFSFAGYIGDFGADASKGQLYLPVDAGYDNLRRRLLVVNGQGNVVYYGVDGGSTPPSESVSPPVLTLAAPLNVVNTSSVSVSGTVTAGSRVSCVLNLVPVASWSGAGTAWSCVLNDLTPNADNQIMVIATNASPITETKNATVKYVVGGPSVKVDPVSYYVNNESLPLYGDTDADSVQVCKGTSCTPAVITTGRWNHAGVTLVTGDNTDISVKATKNAIEITQPVHNVVYDGTAPTLKLSVVANNATVSEQVQNITGLVSDPQVGTGYPNGLLESVTVNTYVNADAIVPLTSQQAVVTKTGIFSTALVGVTYYNVVARDFAGNVTTAPANGKYAISYNPSAAKVALTSADLADASIVTLVSQTLSGTMDRPLSWLKVKGVNATINNTNLTWNSSLVLDYDSVTKDGLNDIQIQASVDGTTWTTSKVTLVYDPANPEATIVTPKIDLATKSSSYEMQVMDGTAVLLSYTFQGKTVTVPSLAPFPVSFNAEGSFPVTLTADDSNGASSQVVRNMIYDITPPKLDYAPKYSSIVCTNGCTQFSSACPAESGVCNETAYSGTVEAGASIRIVDATTNSPITTPVSYTNMGQSWSVSLATARDPYDTLVLATDAAGNVTRSYPVVPDGNMLVDTAENAMNFNQADVTHCMSKVTDFGPKVAPDYPAPFTVLTPQELAHGDIGPLSNGNANPDGNIDIVDCLLALRKLNGFSVSY